ncbi:alpha/beta hydrolase-fold protein [uncultured Maribacter sp.]|uniref:alpha/beta hydrolase-fold protein n=1 Tax=uncultured Maribacter sp. TaxID=431308 RepID=UPI0030ED65AE
MNFKNIGLFLFFLLVLNTGFSQKNKDIVIGKEVTMFSDTLNQERTILIHLPKSYNDTIYAPKNYPLLFLLDAQEHFELATGILNFMSNRLDSKLIPEFIIVGIKSENRISDYTPTNSTINPEGVFVDAFKVSGNSNKFLSFVEYELLPKIRKDYRTAPFKILTGHSLGGLIVASDYISDGSLFDGYIAIDPSLWWDDGLLTKFVQSSEFNQEEDSTKKMYISGANNSNSIIDTTAMRVNQEKFYKAIKSKLNIASKVKYEIFENEDHGTIPLPSIYKGLQFIFENYKMNGMLGASANEIQKHFNNISQTLGMKLRPEERVIDILGNYFLESTNEIEKAISYFELNVTNYPNSYHAYYSLAIAESTYGQLEKAKLNYEKSLELKPDNIIAQENLKKLVQASRDK